MYVFCDWIRRHCCGARRIVQHDPAVHGGGPNQAVAQPYLPHHAAPQPNLPNHAVPQPNIPIEAQIEDDFPYAECHEFRSSGLKYKQAAKGLDGEGRLLLLQEMHRDLGRDMDLRFAARLAIKCDDLPCFLYAHENGAFSPDAPFPYDNFPFSRNNPIFPPECPMALAADHGAMSILEYGLCHKDAFSFDWRSLVRALEGGNVQIVDLVLRAGCPRLDAAASIAAAYGQLDCVRYLHARGFPLWDQVGPIRGFRHGFIPGFQHGFIPDSIPDFHYTYDPFYGWVDGSWSRPARFFPPPVFAFTVFLGRIISEFESEILWGVLRYGEVHGAPVLGALKWVLRERRERAREVVLCFHTATRLSRGGGESRGHGPLWGAMARVPADVVRMLLVVAELEIEEAFKPRLPPSGLGENG